MKQSKKYLIICTVFYSFQLSAQHDIDGSRNVNSSSQGVNILPGSYHNIQLTTAGWSGSHALLFNAYKNVSQVSGNLSKTGNTKYSNSVGSFRGGAGAIMFFGNGGTMDFLMSPSSTGINNDVVWGTPK